MSTLLRITTVPISLKLLLTGQMRYMAQHGFRVIMASAEGPEREEVIAKEGCPHVIIPFTRAITPLQDLKCLWLLIQLIRRERPDIIHTHTPKAGLLGMLAARFTGVPVRIHTIAGLPFMTASGFRRRLLIAMEKLTFWGAQHVWPNSQSMLTYVREQQLCPERKLDLIEEGSTNGIDLQQFSPATLVPEKLAEIKATFAYDPQYTYLLAVGRIVKDKGIPELVAAFTALQAEYPLLRLLLIGPLEEERTEELLPPATLAAIRENSAIQHIAWTDEVACYLHLADILVHASHREGFPNVPLQAGAMLCPLVCSEIPGNVDIVTHGETGLLFKVGDPDHLVAMLRAALQQPEQAQAMARHLRAKIEQQFDRPVVHAALLARYRELLGKPRSTS